MSLQIRIVALDTPSVKKGIKQKRISWFTSDNTYTNSFLNHPCGTMISQENIIQGLVPSAGKLKTKKGSVKMSLPNFPKGRWDQDLANTKLTEK